MLINIPIALVAIAATAVCQYSFDYECDEARFGGTGDFLFGEWGAVDMMYAPVVTRFITYAIPVPRFAAAYMQAVVLHPQMQEWIGGAQAEDWVIERFEHPEVA